MIGPDALYLALIVAAAWVGLSPDRVAQPTRAATWNGISNGAGAGIGRWRTARGASANRRRDLWQQSRDLVRAIPLLGPLAVWAFNIVRVPVTGLIRWVADAAPCAWDAVRGTLTGTRDGWRDARDKHQQRRTNGQRSRWGRAIRWRPRHGVPAWVHRLHKLSVPADRLRGVFARLPRRRRAPGSLDQFRLDCPVCQVSGHTGTQAEVTYLATQHDKVAHAGAANAQATPVAAPPPQISTQQARVNGAAVPQPRPGAVGRRLARRVGQRRAQPPAGGHSPAWSASNQPPRPPQLPWSA